MSKRDILSKLNFLVLRNISQKIPKISYRKNFPVPRNISQKIPKISYQKTIFTAFPAVGIH